MSLSPAEIRHVEIGRSLFGYKRTAIDGLLDDIVDSFEQVWRDRADLTDKVEQLEADMLRYRELETLLRTTLVSAERASNELKNQARKEAELIVTEAQNEARAINRDARSEYERLSADAHRIRALLGAALRTIDKDEPKAEAA
ncbi:MAG TPA: DivIVA domain-containing protein [Gaiellaceae bacterium]